MKRSIVYANISITSASCSRCNRDAESDGNVFAERGTSLPVQFAQQPAPTEISILQKQMVTSRILKTLQERQKTI